MTAPVQSFPPTDLGNAPVAMALGFTFPIAGSGARIKSIQAFSITIGSSSTSNTATITSVDTTKSVIFHTGNTGGSSTEIRSAQASLVLTNATTVTASRSNTTNALTVTGAVVEFK